MYPLFFTRERMIGMFKKLCIMIGGLFAIIIVIISSHNTLLAEDVATISNTKANVCSYGTATGRIGDLQKGDNIRLGISRSDGVDLGWYLIKNTHDKTWFTMSSISAGSSVSTGTTSNGANWRYTNTKIKPYITALNNKLSLTTIEKSIIEERNFDHDTDVEDRHKSDRSEKFIFMPSYFEIYENATYTDLVLELGDLTWTLNNKFDAAYLDEDGNSTISDYFTSTVMSFANNRWAVIELANGNAGGTAGDVVKIIRPAAIWNLNNVAFSVSNDDIQYQCVNDVESPSYNPEEGFISATGNMMNIRFKDPSIKVKLDDIVAIKANGSIGTSTRSLSVGDSFRLKYSGATAGTDKMISMLVSDTNGDMVYYMQIDKAKVGSQYVDIDTSGWKTGTYYIQLANEIITDSNSPTYSSELTAPIEITIHDDLSSLEVSLTPDAVDASKQFFESGVNANSGSSIAKIKTKNGVEPIRFEILDGKGMASHKGLFEIEKGVNGLPKIQSDGTVRIRATQHLSAGVYYFRVQAYDANNKPSPAVYEDGSSVSESGITKGVISDNIKVIVYPTGANISYEAQYNEGKNFNVSDIQSKPSSVLGILGLQPSFNVAGVSVSYAIKDVLVKGIATDDLEITSANASLGKITGRSNVVDGEHTFTAVVSFKEGINTYQIELPNQKLTIAPSLYFTKTASDTTKITKLSVAFADIEADRIFTVFAKGDSRIEYRIAPSNVQDGVLEIIGASDGANTTGIFKMQKAGTTKVEAFVKENGTIISSAILIVEITQGELPDFTFTLDGSDLAIPEIVSTYAPNKQHQLAVKDAPAGSRVHWRLDADEQGMHNGMKIDDIIHVEEDTGMITILNANLRTQTDVKVIATLSVSGYADKELDPILVTIEKARQDKLKFAQPVYQMPNGSGSFTPRFKNGADSEDGSFNYILKSDDVRVSVNKDMYSYQVSDSEGASITLKAVNKGNRNYLQSDEITAILRILKPGETLPNVEVLPNRILTYGERVTLQVRDSDPDAVYTFTSMDPSVLEQDAVEENVFHTKDVSDSVTIKITKVLAGFEESDEYITLQVNPKPIEVELKQTYKIKTGEAMPSFELKDFKVGDILLNDVLPSPIIEASIKDTLKAGIYPISLRYPDELDAHKYNITLKKANLIIEQDYVDVGWIKAYPKEDTTKTMINPEKWYGEDIVVELIDTSYGYDQISNSKTGDWSTSFLVSEEGEQQVDVYFRNSTSGSISEAVTITMKIDKTAPSIPKLTIEELSRGLLARFLRQISFGAWMKQEVAVQLSAVDTLSGIKEYRYLEDGQEKVTGDGKLRYGNETKLSLKAMACDYAGNCSSYSEAVQVLVDSVAPEIHGVKDKSVYKQYYIPRFVKVIDVGSGVAHASYTRNTEAAIALQENVTEKILGKGTYRIKAQDHAGNEVEISFVIVPLPDIETEIDGSDASKDIIDQVQKELDEARDQLTPEEIEDHEKWIEDATQKWEDSRKRIIETEDKTAKVEGIGDTSFDPTLTLVVEEVTHIDDIKLPRKAKVIYDVYLKKGNTILQPNGEIKVYLPYHEEVKPIVYQIDENGGVRELPATKEGNFVTFITSKLLRYAISDVLQEETTCKLNGVKINIDTDNDGLPDINLDIDEDCSADLNIDMNTMGEQAREDQIPDLNIDTTGDGKADINIDVNMDGKADINIAKVTSWNPKLDANYQGFAYDTMANILPEINIDVNGDGKPDFNIDSDFDGIADTNLLDKEQLDKENAMGGVATGDSSKWMIWSIALLISLTTVLYSLVKQRRRKQRYIQ